MKEPADKHPRTTPPPTASQRQVAKARIVKTVGGWLEVCIDEVFDMADEDNDKEPQIGERVTWRDLEGVVEHIRSRLDDDMGDCLGELVLDVLEQELAQPRELQKNE